LQKDKIITYSKQKGKDSSQAKRKGFFPSKKERILPNGKGKEEL
jgi:hypothetical protein